jgi:type I restriction enzyme S subunit
MFPKDGKNVPEVRFNGFDDTWKFQKLKSFAEFNPKANLPEKFKYVDLESVAGTEMIAYRDEKKGTAPSRAQRLARQGDLFYQTVRPYQKNNYLFEMPYENFVFSTGYAQIRPNIDGNFLLALVQNNEFVKSVLIRCTGTSYPAINSNDLADMAVFIPSEPDEQEQIGTFFRTLDKLTSLQRIKIEKLKNLKKACFEKMFN